MATFLATPNVKPFLQRGTEELLLWTNLMIQLIPFPFSRKGVYQTFYSILGSYYGVTRKQGKLAIALTVVYAKKFEGP